MEVVGSAIASVSFLVCLVTVMFACSFCRKIFKRKKKENKNDEENGNAPDDKKENGITNPAYEAATKQSNDVKPENDVTITTKEVIINEEENERAIQEKTKEKEFTQEKIKQDAEDTSNKLPENEKKEKSSSSTSVSEIDQDESSKVHDKKENINTTEVDLTSQAVQNEAKQPLEDRKPLVDPPIIVSQSNEPQESSFNNDVGRRSVENITSNKSDTKKEMILPTILDDDEMQPEWIKFKDVAIQGGWRLDVKLTDLLRFGLIDTKTADQLMEENEDKSRYLKHIKPFLEGENPIAGVLVSESGEKKSIYKSAKEGILRRGTAISLLEAQAANGNIIDPITGKKMSVTEGYKLGLLDKVYETVLSRAERAVNGYKSRITNESMPLGQAMERGLVIESHGMRLLETQLATGGIIDHKVNLKLPIELALKRKLLSEKAAQKLIAACMDVGDEEKSDNLKTFFDPNTEENVTYRELIRRSVIDNDTGMRLYPLEKVGKKRYSYSSFSGRSSLVSSRSGSTEDITVAVNSE